MSSPYTEDQAELHHAICRLGLAEPDERVRFEPLVGGVSSDILLVTTGRRKFCIKRALSRLKVAAVWEAPITRNAAEAAWLRQVGEWFPDNVPAVIAADAQAGLFAMDFLPSDAYPVWKSQLATGSVDVRFAGKVGEVLCAIHRKSAASPTLAKQFSNDDTFELIRLSPYFRATAVVHPSLAPRLHALADRTLSTKLALVHGDVSPKNILCGPKGPVLLDAECAWYGDPAFDLAFCLNHLLLKAVWHPQWTPGYMQSFSELSRAYLSGMDWESAAAFESRCAALLPALALARVDGKSPAEYLTEAVQKECVRNWATALILNPVDTLDAVGAACLRNIHV